MTPYSYIAIPILWPLIALNLWHILMPDRFHFLNDTGSCVLYIITGICGVIWLTVLLAYFVISGSIDCACLRQKLTDTLRWWIEYDALFVGFAAGCLFSLAVIILFSIIR